jgi:hypothetical protein
MKMTMMTPEIAKEKILSLLSEVKRDGIDNLIKFVKESDYLTDATCYSHHKDRYGLMFHSLEVLDTMLGSAAEGLARDSIILVGLCHDLGKARKDGQHLGRGRHPQRSLYILRKCGVKLSDLERDAIGYHHPKTVKAYASAVTNPLQRLLHRGDCKSTGMDKEGSSFVFNCL